MLSFKMASLTAITMAMVACSYTSTTPVQNLTEKNATSQLPVSEAQQQESVAIDPFFKFDTSQRFAAKKVDIRGAKKINPGEYHPNSKRMRKARGEKVSEKGESLFSEKIRAQLLKESHALSPNKDMQNAGKQGPTGMTPKAPSAVGSFESMDETETNGYTPPDPELAVGLNHVIAVANSAMEVYNKSGTSLVGPMALTTLFAGTVCGDTGNFLAAFDPNVLYDEEYDRYIIGVDQKDGSSSNHYCVAVSETNDPTTTWFIYEFNTQSGGLWMDYPHAGVGDDAIYMGGNMFGGGFSGGRVWAFDKRLMYSGLPTQVASQATPAGLTTPQPINLHGFNQGTWPNGQPHYIMMSNGFTTTSVTTLSWTNPFNGSNGVLSNLGSINLGATGSPVSNEQSGASNFASYSDARVLDFEYRNGYGWTTHTVACNPGSGTVNCIRWAQIDLSTITLGPAGTGTFGSDNEYRIYPDLAVNHCDDMSVGYTHSSDSTFPSIRVNGRESGDAANTLQTETTLINATVPYTANYSRWGDYTGMTIDPDGETFWYLGQYSKVTSGGNNWGLRIGSFRYTGCDADVTQPADAYIRDLPADVGFEPDPVPGNMWTSQEIWNSTDTNPAGGHENPEFGQTNYVFVRLINAGPNQTPTNVSGRIHLYYANASTGLAWDSDWTEFGTIPVSNLAAWNSIEDYAPFNPPGTGHYCIVARFVADDDPMTFAEGTSINTNTRNNNNIAWRNMNVVDDVLLPEGVSNEVIVRNISREYDQVHLGLADLSRIPFLEFGQITLHLEDEMLERWMRNGARGEGIFFNKKTREIIIKSKNAMLYNINMKYKEAFKAKVHFKAPRPTGRNFHISLTQYDEKRQAVGGVDYQIQAKRKREN